MKLESIAEYLEGLGYGRRGKDIFALHMPEKATVGILLLNPLQGVPIDHELPGYRKGHFTVIIRHSSYSDGKELAEQISNELTLLEKQLTDVLIKYVRPRTEPIAFPNSKGDNLEFAVTFDTAYILN